MKAYLFCIVFILASFPVLAQEQSEKHYYDKIIMKSGATITADVFYVNVVQKYIVYARADNLGGGEISPDEVAEISFDEGNPELPWSALTWYVPLAAGIPRFIDDEFGHRMVNKDSMPITDRKAVKVTSFKNGALEIINVNGSTETFTQKEFFLACLGAKSINKRLKMEVLYQEKNTTVCVPYTYAMLLSQHKSGVLGEVFASMVMIDSRLVRMVLVKIK